MPLYEHIYIARQDISPSQVEALTQNLTDLITRQGGTIAKSEYWGLRTLQYKIKKNRKGHYSLLNISAPAEAVQEMERQMKINEDVLRFMTLRVETHDKAPSPVMARRDRDERGGGRGDRDRGDRNRGDRGPRDRGASDRGGSDRGGSDRGERGDRDSRDQGPRDRTRDGS